MRCRGEPVRAEAGCRGDGDDARRVLDDARDAGADAAYLPGAPVVVARPGAVRLASIGRTLGAGVGLGSPSTPRTS